MLIDEIAHFRQDVIAQLDAQEVRVEGGMHSLFKTLDDRSGQIRSLPAQHPYQRGAISGVFAFAG